MSYTKTVWADGDVISTARLNKIETGIEEAYSSGTSEPDFVITTIMYEPESVSSAPGYEFICTGISFNEIINKILNSSSLNAVEHFKIMASDSSGDYQVVQASLGQLILRYQKNFHDNDNEYDENITGIADGDAIFDMNESQITIHFFDGIVYDYTYDSTTKTYTLTEAVDEQGNEQGSE